MKPISRRRRSLRRALCVETCERRVVPAGNVTVVFNAGTVTVTGDNRANVVDINVVANQVIVQGFQGTTINGSNDPFVVVPAGNTINDHLVVNLGDGKDVLSLRNVRVNRSITVDTGAGNDRVVIDDIATNLNPASDINIQLGQGSDQLLVDRLDSGNDLIINDAGGKTLIALNDVQTADDLFILTSKGRQEVTAFGLQVAERMILSFGGSSRGTALIADTTVDRVGITGSNGSDAIVAVLDTQNAGQNSVVQLLDGRDSMLVEGNWQTPTTLDGNDARDSLFALPAYATPNGLVKQNFETDVSPAGEGDIPRSFGRRINGLFRSVERANARLEGVLS